MKEQMIKNKVVLRVSFMCAALGVIVSGCISSEPSIGKSAPLRISGETFAELDDVLEAAIGVATNRIVVLMPDVVAVMGLPNITKYDYEVSISTGENGDVLFFIDYAGCYPFSFFGYPRNFLYVGSSIDKKIRKERGQTSENGTE